MKKWLIGTALAIIVICALGAASLTTRISSYKILHSTSNINSADTDPNARDGYRIATTSGEVDLLVKAGAGSNTYANALSLIVHVDTGADGDTVTQVLYGRAEQGPKQRIASIVWKIGTAQVDATTTNLWAETATVTSSHITNITVAGADGDNRVGSVTFDATAYRYIKGYWTADSGDPCGVTCLYRVY